MTFAHPWFLAGTLAALIPLLVHLFDRRRPRQVPFGAISFVLRSQKRTASRLKLKRLLLYALRTLFFLAVPIALARPELTKDAGALGARGAAATAIVLDTSLSMRWKDGRSLFAEGQRQAKAAVAELLPEEPATVLACARSAAPPAAAGFERARLLAAIDEAAPSYEAADLNRCLELAAHALDDSPLSNRRLVVVSAFTQGGLRLEVPPPVAAGPKGEKVKPEVVLRDVAEGRDELPNRAVVDARAEPAFHVGPRAWQLTFTVKNFSKVAAKDVALQLKVDGQVVGMGFLDLPPSGTAQKTLTHRFAKGGVVTVEGALAPDALPEDDVRALVLSVPRELKALVVNGGPSPQKYRDEAFFTDAALSAPGSPVKSVVRDADAAWREDFAAYDVVLLLNTPAPAPEVAQKLSAFVEAGGGLFLSLGDRVEADAWNATLGALAPRRIRVVKTAVEPTAPDAAARAARLQSLNGAHAVMAPFTGRAREGLLSTRFSRYALFEADATAGDVDVLGTMDDGAPAFLAARRGKGRVFAFASTVDRDWSDLCIRTGFLPLMQRVAAWLTGTLEEREEIRARVGEVVALAPEPGATPAVAKAPSGRELPVQRAPQAAVVTAGPLPEPGPYAVLDGTGAAVEALAFAAALDPAASDLTRHPLDEVTAWFGEDLVRAAGEGARAAKTPVWTWLLVVAALAFFFEGTLLRK